MQRHRRIVSFPPLIVVTANPQNPDKRQYWRHILT
jgi:hypothetical protein